jgi:uncharacterized protein (DUF58 family)
MNPVVGWSLAVIGIAAGYAAYGWPGVVLAFSVIVFWLLLQFSRVMRVMRMAAGRPPGAIDNAVMLHTRIKPGMKLLQILPLTRSLGRKVADEPETFVWTDAGGDRVRVELRDGLCTRVRLERAAPGDDGPPTAA